MKALQIIILCILVFLAVSSGLTKMALMEQEVQFFGSYGFGNVLLVGFGAVQVAGGAMLIFSKTRIVGAVLVALTFAVSAVLLILDENFGLAIVTLVALGLLGMTMKLKPQS